MHLFCTIELPQEVKDRIADETSLLRCNHPEYDWFPPDRWRITLYYWPHVPNELVLPLQRKVEELTFEERPFVIFGLRYCVFIQNHIEIRLQLQQSNNIKRIGRSLHDYFAGIVSYQSPPYFFIPLARYKIPAKQQYSHLKNTLEKISCDFELCVSELSLQKTTYRSRNEWHTTQICVVRLQK
jgi:2'-5' RNA ligase